MRGLCLLSLLACAGLSAVNARIRRQPEAPETAKVGDGTDASEHCQKLCEADKGTDADLTYCLNECAVYTDLTEFDHDGPTIKGLHDFVEDEAFNEENEDGGAEMEKKYEESYPMPVADCHPEREDAPKFDEMDINGDGSVSKEEANFRGQELCVPNEKTEQIFSHADSNHDDAIDKGEFEDAGEDTKVEEAVDEALAPSFKGDDEYNEVQSPTDEDGVKVMENFDKNKDGTLDEKEFEDAAEFETERRGLENDEAKTQDILEKAKPEVHEAFDKVDANDDNEISTDEYMAKGEGSDMGKEMQEETESDEKAPDPDNSNRVGTKPTSMMQRSKRKAGFARMLTEAARDARIAKLRHHAMLQRKASRSKAVSSLKAQGRMALLKYGMNMKHLAKEDKHIGSEISQAQVAVAKALKKSGASARLESLVESELSKAKGLVHGLVGRETRAAKASLRRAQHK